MKIVTGTNNTYDLYLQNLMESIYDFGHECLIYDLGGLGYGIKIDAEFPREAKHDDYLPKHPKKPWMIEDALDRVEEKRGMTYMDADTEIRARFDEVWGRMFDVGITVYPEEWPAKSKSKLSYVTGYLNAGVIFMRNTDATRKFIGLWKKEIGETKTGSDQEALTRIVRRATDLKPDETYNWKGIKIRLFPCMDYNNTLGELPNQKYAKIVHYAGEGQIELIDRVREKLCS